MSISCTALGRLCRFGSHGRGVDVATSGLLLRRFFDFLDRACWRYVLLVLIFCFVVGRAEEDALQGAVGEYWCWRLGRIGDLRFFGCGIRRTAIESPNASMAALNGFRRIGSYEFQVVERCLYLISLGLA
jgi:hypothetical protein